MADRFVRVEITVSGLVQGVGFRYFIYSKAQNLGLKGYTKNLISGKVVTVVEGEKHLVDELVDYIKIGPSRSHVKSFSADLFEFKNEFTTFEIKY